MAKSHTPDEPSHATHAAHAGHAASPRGDAGGADSFTVTFAGQPPTTVQAASPEVAVLKVKEQLSVISTETPPTVDKVHL